MTMQFLRRWRLTISSPSSVKYDNMVVVDNTYKDEFYNKTGLIMENQIIIEDPMRVKFDLKVTALREANDGSITIYNLSPQTESQIIREGTLVKLEAGYEENMSIIYVGNIIQPIRGKENGTDYFLKLIVMGADDYRNLAFASGVLNSNLSRRDMALQVLRYSNIRPGVIYIEDLPDLEVVDGSTPKTERPKVLFGPTSEYMDQIAKMGGTTSYISNKGELRFFKPVVKSIDQTYVHEVNMETGMIGMPQKEGYGITVRTLLNPQVSIGDFLHIDNKSVLQDQLSLGEIPYLLDEDGLYRVISISYEGDTRDTEWYTTFTTFTQSAKIPGILKDEFGETII